MTTEGRPAVNTNVPTDPDATQYDNRARRTSIVWRHPKLALTFTLLAVATLVAVVWTLWAERERPTELRVLNADTSGGTALVVYHPGLTDFQERVTNAFADGLVANGWRVEITTASGRAPIELSSYDLLVLGSPTYWWTPARPVTRYVDQVTSLNDRQAILIVTCSGMCDRSASVLSERVRDAGGEVVQTLKLSKWAPTTSRPQVITSKSPRTSRGGRQWKSRYLRSEGRIVGLAAHNADAVATCLLTNRAVLDCSGTNGSGTGCDCRRRALGCARRMAGSTARRFLSSRRYPRHHRGCRRGACRADRTRLGRRVSPLDCAARVLRSDEFRGDFHVDWTAL